MMSKPPNELIGSETFVLSKTDASGEISVEPLKLIFIIKWLEKYPGRIGQMRSWKKCQLIRQGVNKIDILAGYPLQMRGVPVPRCVVCRVMRCDVEGVHDA